jgi:hypothetical protein
LGRLSAGCAYGDPPRQRRGIRLLHQDRHGLQIRMSAVATVAEKLNRCEIFDDPRFAVHADKYLNLLIRPDLNGWKYDESDRHRSYRASGLAMANCGTRPTEQGTILHATPEHL